MRRKAYPFLFLVAVTVLAFWKVVFHGEFTLLTGNDLASAYYPWFDFAAYWMKRGVFPLWDPFVYAGKPFMGEPQPGLYYPLNWLFMLLPARGGGVNLDGLQTLIILDYLLAGCFAYALARSLGISAFGSALGGASFSLGGYSREIYGYINILSGFVWLPLAVLTFRRAVTSEGAGSLRRRLAWCGIVLALSFLPGHHIPLIHAGLFLLFYGIYIFLAGGDLRLRRGLGMALALGSAAVIAGLITAVQWIPSLEWAQSAYRWIGEGDPLRWGEPVPYSSLEQAGNILPQDLISLVLPHVGSRTSIYVGAVILFLSAVGILFARGSDSRFFSIAVFLYLLLSLGRYSSLHGWVNTFVPGVWFAREVFHYLIPMQLCISMLAAWGLDQLVHSFREDGDGILRVFIKRTGWGIALTVPVSVAAIVLLFVLEDLPLEHPYVTGTASLAVSLSMLGVLLFLSYTRRMRPELFRVFVLAVVVLDLASQISANIPEKNRPEQQGEPYVRAVWTKGAAVNDLLARRGDEVFRTDDPEQIFPQNFGDVWRLEATMGHGATALVDYFAFRGTGWGPSSNASALLNVRYFTSRESLPGMNPVFESESFRILSNPRAVPRATLIHRYRSFENEQDLLNWIDGPLFAPSETVLFLRGEMSSRGGDFWRSLEAEDEGLRIRLVESRIGAETIASSPGDETARHRARLFRPPWGWGDGDSVTWTAHPERPADRAFLIVNFYPTIRVAARLWLTLAGPGGERVIPLELPGAGAGGTGLSRASFDLGPLEAVPYRFFLRKDKECAARIDSVRLSRSDAGPENGARVEIGVYEPNRITLEARSDRPGLLLLSEVYYPGWSATVDGEPAPILKGDYILRAIPVGTGSHRVELRYQPLSFRLGLGVSLVSLLGAALYLGFGNRARS